MTVTGLSAHLERFPDFFGSKVNSLTRIIRIRSRRCRWLLFRGWGWPARGWLSCSMVPLDVRNLNLKSMNGQPVRLSDDRFCENLKSLRWLGGSCGSLEGGQSPTLALVHSNTRLWRNHCYTSAFVAFSANSILVLIQPVHLYFIGLAAILGYS